MCANVFVYVTLCADVGAMCCIVCVCVNMCKCVCVYVCLCADVNAMCVDVCVCV